MKLELKHLAPYLPYNLKVTKDNWGKIFKVDCDGTTLNCVGVDYVLHCQAKPILRPLSLIIEDCIDGKSPLELIRDKYNEENEEPITSVEFHNIGGITLYGLMTIDSFEVSMPYWAYEMLFSWHFDVFGLIPAGLATELS